MFIRSIRTDFKPHYKIITNWGKTNEFFGNKFIGVEHHYYDDILMKKRYVIANGKTKVFSKIRNLFGQFDRVV